MINSRSLDDLDPETREMAERLVEACKVEWIDIMITSTFRDKASQNAIYAQGRTSQGTKVTNAMGGRSFHQYRCAFDFCPLDEHGKPNWSDLGLFRRVGEIGVGLGLKWGGNFKSFVDMPHFQHDRGMTIMQWSAMYPSGERAKDWK